MVSEMYKRMYVYKEMYIALLNSTEEVMEYINREMVIPENYDWNHTREILCQLQAALQTAEDIYVEAEED